MNPYISEESTYMIGFLLCVWDRDSKDETDGQYINLTYKLQWGHKSFTFRGKGRSIYQNQQWNWPLKNLGPLLHFIPRPTGNSDDN